MGGAWLRNSFGYLSISRFLSGKASMFPDDFVHSSVFKLL